MKKRGGMRGEKLFISFCQYRLLFFCHRLTTHILTCFISCSSTRVSHRVPKQKLISKLLNQIYLDQMHRWLNHPLILIVLCPENCHFISSAGTASQFTRILSPSMQDRFTSVFSLPLSPSSSMHHEQDHRSDIQLLAGRGEECVQTDDCKELAPFLPNIFELAKGTDKQYKSG